MVSVNLSHQYTRILDPSPQLLWANVLAICASLLLVLVLLTLAVGKWQHFSRLLLLCAPLSLVTCVAAAFAAQHFYATYASWQGFFNEVFTTRISDDPLTLIRAYNEIVTENGQATVFGWLSVLVTGILLTLGLVGMWRLSGKAST